MTDSCLVIPIIVRQETAIVDLWCRDCGAEQEQLMPVSATQALIKQTVCCLGCGRTGFMTEA